MSNVIQISLSPLDRNTEALNRVADELKRQNDIAATLSAPPILSVDMERGQIRAVQDIVATYFGMTTKVLLVKRKVLHIARPRQIAIALCDDLLPQYSTTIIAKHFRVDHTTVIHARRRVAGLVATTADVRADYAACEARVIAALEALQEVRSQA